LHSSDPPAPVALSMAMQTVLVVDGRITVLA
jgi:hypothetical protein